jgi:hypothetical protein
MNIGPACAYCDVTAHWGQSETRRKTMASKKATKKMKKGKKLEATKPLTDISFNYGSIKYDYKQQ